MNKISWNEVETRLRERRAAGTMRDAGAFGEDFKARARLVRQEVPEGMAAWRAPALKWGYASLAAAAVVVAVMLWPARADLLTQVKSLKVLAPHSGVIIMNDEGGKGTVVWITDLDSNDGGKG